MQVILLEKIGRIGKLGDVVNVKNGFARNFLIPQGKARLATKENLENFQVEKNRFQEREREVLKRAQEDAEKLSTSSVSIPRKAGVDGKLFGAVTAADIAEAIVTQVGVDVKKINVKLAQPYKSIGEYSVMISLHHDVQVEFAVSVVSC